MQATEMKKFLDTLELPDRDTVHAGRRFTFPTLPAPAGGKTDGVPTHDPTKASAAIDDGSLVSFVAGVSLQHQADALNSTLLAQLAANKKYDRENDVEDWYGFYKTVLENVGWEVQKFDFQKFNPSGSGFTMDKVVLDLLASIATQDDIAVINETIKALKALSNSDGRVVLFEQATHTTSKGNFQICACSESAGVLMMKIGAFSFSSTETVTSVLWFTFSSSSANVYQGGQVMNLDNDVYSQNRSAIVTKLGAHAAQFVGDLDI